MKTATLRDLRYSFSKIEAWLRAGEEVQITKHSKLVGQLTPPVKQKAPKFDVKEHRARIRRIWGGRVFSAKEVEEMRAFESGEP